MKKETWLGIALLFLGIVFWLTLAPLSFGRDLAPAGLIARALPAKTTMKNASKAEFLAAVCNVVRKNRKTAGALTAAAIEARSELAGEIVGTVLRCSRQVDCDFAGVIVKAAVAAAPSAATSIGDAAVAKAQDCGETIQAAIRAAAVEATAIAPGAVDQSPLPGTRPGIDENFDPREPLVLVCVDGVQRTVRDSQVEEFLRANPGSYLGSCPPPPAPPPPPPPSATPVPNR